MTPNEVWTLGIAAYAAIIATFVLGWDAYKWLNSGPKVRVTASTDMRIVGGIEVDPKTYVSVVAVNLGDRATTLTNLGLLYYDSWFNALRRKKSKYAAVIKEPSQTQAIPYRFEPGAQWIGMAEQSDEVVQMIRDGHLFVVLYHSHGGGGVRYRLKPKALAKRKAKDGAA